MIKPDWAQDKPSTDWIQNFWEEVEVTHVPSNHPAIDAVLHHFRLTNVNGQADFVQFQLSPHPVLQWYFSRADLNGPNFFDIFLSLPSVMAILRAPLTSAMDIQSSNSLILDDEIAETLVQGGAYRRFSGTYSEAKILGQQFCNVLIEDRYAEVQIYKSFAAWSEWFLDAPWDVTWFGLDKQKFQIWLLRATDTD